MFEAGMEARQNYRQSVDNFMLTFEDKNGRPPTSTEIDKFLSTAESAANGVFGLNMAILSVSNMAMFGKTIGIAPQVGRSIDNSFNRLIGLGVSADATTGRLVMQQATRGQKILGNTYKILGKSLVSEGLFEEGLQGVAGTAMQKYLEDKYDPKAKDADSMFSYLGQALSQQYTTQEGWKEIAIGGLVGMFGGVLSRGSVTGFGKESYSYARKNIEKEVAAANEAIDNVQQSITSKNFISRLTDATYAKRASENKTSTPTGLAGADTVFHYLKTNEDFYTVGQSTENFERIVQETDFTKEQIQEIEKAGLTVDEFKQQQINDFKQHAENYKFARRSADALVTNGLTDGNASMFRDAYIRNVMMGISAKDNAEKSLKEIQDSTGIDSSIISYYNGLSEENKNNVEELGRLKEERDALLAEFQPLDMQRAELQTQTSPDVVKEKNLVAEKRLRLQQQVLEKENRIRTIEEALEKAKPIMSEIGSITSQNQLSVPVSDAVKELSKLDDHIDALRSTGQTQEADKIERALHNFKAYADMHREFVTMQQRMVQTDYFKTKPGKSFLDMIIGTNYSMSPEMREFLKNADDRLDIAVNQVLELTGKDDIKGMRNSQTIDAIVEKLIKDREDISEREKFRLESLVRMVLTEYAPYESKEIVEAMEPIPQVSQDPLEGDTVALSVNLAAPTNETTVEALQKEIEQIVAQLEAVLNKPNNQKAARIEQLNGRLRELQKELEDLKKQPETTTQEEQQPISVGKALSKTAIKKLNKLGFTDEMINAMSDEDIATAKTLTSKEDAQELIDKYTTTQATEEQISELQKQLDEATAKLEELKSQQDLTEENQQQIQDLETQISNLKTQVENATIQSEKQNQESGQPGDQQEYQPTDQGQQTQEQASQSETDNSNSNLRSEEEIQKEIEDTQESLRKEKEVIRLMDTEDYKRMEELLAKEQLTDTERIELDSLKSDFDSWSLATGVVVKGVRLSDLVEQKVALEKAQVNTTEQMEEVDPEAVAEISESDSAKKGKVYYENTQTHAVVTIDFRSIQNGLRLSGLHPEDMPKVFTQTNADGTITPIEFEYTYDRQNGNIVIPQKELDKLNTPQSNVMIAAGDSKIPRNYSVLYALQDTPSGEREWKPVETTYNDYTVEMQPEYLYSVNPDDKLNIVVDTRDNFNKKLIEDYNKAKGKKAKKEALEKLIHNLRISVHANSVNVGDLKAFIPFEKLSQKDSNFLALRDKIINDNLEQIVGAPGVLTVKETLSVQKVLPGNPTFLIERNAEGKFFFTFKAITPQEASKIVDLGVVDENGKMQTRRGKTESRLIDTTFLPKTKQKLPFIVIEKGSKLIAYPVRMLENQKPDTEEFKRIWNEVKDPQKKVILLNEFLAKSGVNVKEKGNAFYSLVTSNNLTDEFFNQMLSKIENNKYFYPTNEWLGNSISIQDIVTQRAVVNINLNNPFVAPKLVLDLGGIKPTATQSDEESEESTTETYKNVAGLAGDTYKNLAGIINKEKEEDCGTGL